MEYNRSRRRIDPEFALRTLFPARIRKSLLDGKAGRRWETLVGYTLKQLVVHLERQFLKDMTWDNRDKWHIDHIVPLSSFKFTSSDDPEFKAAWALTNLQPLWKQDNLAKGAKQTFLI
jgi:hypothetical protein